MISKICSKCNNKFPETLEYFRKCNTGKNNFRANCRECDREYSRNYYKNDSVQ